MAGAEPKPPLADETTTNLKLQKIKDTDYAGNFPTIYNNNLDLIDVLNNKQDKLIAGSGITIASDGKTISAKNTGKKLYTGSIDDLIEITSTTISIKKPFIFEVIIFNQVDSNKKSFVIKSTNVTPYTITKGTNYTFYDLFQLDITYPYNNNQNSLTIVFRLFSNGTKGILFGTQVLTNYNNNQLTTNNFEADTSYGSILKFRLYV